MINYFENQYIHESIFQLLVFHNNPQSHYVKVDKALNLDNILP